MWIRAPNPPQVLLPIYSKRISKLSIYSKRISKLPIYSKRISKLPIYSKCISKLYLLNLIHCVISWFNFLISPVNFRVLYSAIVGLPEYGMNNGPHEEFYANTVVMNILKVMLVTLQILHIFWTILIIKTAATKFNGGKVS
jgi:hypothetical protein